MQTNSFRLVVAAGGTGGHIYPAVAVVEALREQLGDAIEVEFLGSEDRLETTIIPALGFRLTSMPIQGFRGLLSPGTLLLPLKIFRSIRIARSLISAFKPHCVICTGAYISYPVGIAAYKENIPFIVMESNVNLGKTNYQLAKRATRIVLSFEESITHIPSRLRSKAVVLGNPVRSMITREKNVGECRMKMGLREDLPTILVFGGSLGARSINSTVQRMVNAFANDEIRRDIQIIWQTGKNFKPEIPADIGHLIRTMPFIDDMDSAYGSADLVISRSGATTLAELGIVGKPAILVPLPSASMNEQLLNGRIAEERGAAIVVPDDEVSERLPRVIRDLLDDPLRLTVMSASMKKLGREHAAHDVARLVLETGGRTFNGERA